MSSAGRTVMLLAVIAGSAAVGGCGGKDEPAPPPAPPDASPLVMPAPGITELPATDPTDGMHLDGKERDTPAPVPGKRNRNARTIGIMLRSTPSGAIAAVDGTALGPTPAYWEGEVGGEREFTFALANHAVARYRFVPITNGVVHGRLEPIESRPGAGVPAIPRPAQSVVPVGPGTVPSAGVIQVAPQGTTVTPSAPNPQPDPSDDDRGPAPPTTAPSPSPSPSPSEAPTPTPVPTTAPDGATPATTAR